MPVPSTLLKRLNGNTASFTETPLAWPSPDLGKILLVLNSAIEIPVDISAAAFAN